MLLSTRTLLVHVGTAHELAAEQVAVLAGTFVTRLQESQSVVAVELERVQNHDALSVVPPHHFIGELVNRALEPGLFRVDVDLDAVL